MNILSIVWDVSPYIHQFSETYALRWYGVLFALAFVLSYYVLAYQFNKENLPESLLNKISIACIIGGVCFSRIGHCLFYEPAYYLNNPLEFLHIWKGGMSSHGGAIGVLLAYLVISTKKYPYGLILSRTLLVVPLAGVFFRMGNLMNSEIYGTATNLPWGFVFVNSSEVLRGVETAIPRHPTQIYEALCYLALFIVFVIYCGRKNKRNEALSNTFIIGLFSLVTFGSRFLIEFLKLPQVSFEQGLTFNMGQILSIPFIITGIILLWIHHKEKAGLQ